MKLVIDVLCVLVGAEDGDLERLPTFGVDLVEESLRLFRVVRRQLGVGRVERRVLGREVRRALATRRRDLDQCVAVDAERDRARHADVVERRRFDVEHERRRGPDLRAVERAVAIRGRGLDLVVDGHVEAVGATGLERVDPLLVVAEHPDRELIEVRLGRIEVVGVLHEHHAVVTQPLLAS